MGPGCAAAHPGVNNGPAKSSAALLGLRSRPVGLRTGEPYCPATHAGMSIPDMAPLDCFYFKVPTCLYGSLKAVLIASQRKPRPGILDRPEQPEHQVAT